MIPWYPLYTPNSQGVFSLLKSTVLEHRGKILGENDTLEKKSGLIWFPVLVTSPLTGVLSKIPRNIHSGMHESPVESLTAFSHHHRVHPISRICPHLKMVSQIVHPILPGIPNAKHITDSNGRVDWHHFQVPFHQMWSFLMNCFLLSLRRGDCFAQKNWGSIHNPTNENIFVQVIHSKKKHAFLRIKFDFSLCCHF